MAIFNNSLIIEELLNKLMTVELGKKCQQYGWLIKIVLSSCEVLIKKKLVNRL